MPSTVFSNVEKIDNFIVNKSTLRVRLHPLVAVSILDAYSRRPKKESRAIGTLLGLVSEGNILEITDCFCVLHSDSAERGLLFNQEYHARMCALRQVVHPKEQVVGWFSVGEENKINDSTVQIHSFYKSSKESKFHANTQLNFSSPVFLSIDTAIRDCATPIGIKVFTSDSIPGTDNQLMHFYELPIVVGDYGGQEKNIMDMLQNGCSARYNTTKDGENEHLDANNEVLVRTLDTFTKQLDDLEYLMTAAKTYIGSVLNGEGKPNPEVGRALMRALKSDNLLDSEKLHQLVDGATKDTLMVTYLSSMCKTQIALAEKIQQILSASTNE